MLASRDTDLLDKIGVALAKELEPALTVGDVQNAVNVRVTDFTEFDQVLDERLIAGQIDRLVCVLVLTSGKLQIVSLPNDSDFHLRLLRVVVPRRLGQHHVRYIGQIL